ncbi:MAG: guanylate kinase, partial [Vicinamibacteria bacterium]
AEVHERLYGTGRVETEAVLGRGVDLVLDIDVQGAEQVKRAMADAILIFILPPSFQVLEQRLRDRRQNHPEDIERRLAAARREVSHYTNYDYAVVNDEIERCAALLRAIVFAERAKRQRMEPIVKGILDSFK